MSHGYAVIPAGMIAAAAIGAEPLHKANKVAS